MWWPTSVILIAFKKMTRSRDHCRFTLWSLSPSNSRPCLTVPEPAKRLVKFIGVAVLNDLANANACPKHEEMAHELRALRPPPIRGPDPSNRLAWRGISVDEDTAECRRFVVTLLYWLDLVSTCSHPLQKDQETLPTCESGLPSWSCLAVGNVWKTVKYDVWSAMQWNGCQALQDIHIYICISTCPHTCIYIYTM